MRLSIRIKIIIILFSFAVFGCSGALRQKTEKPTIDYSIINKAYYEYPPDLIDPELTEKTIEFFKTNLIDRRIFIDPGHGGEDRRNKSRNGEVVEADVNLRVSHFLKDFLERAGAVVSLSRNEDSTIALLERPQMAESFNADVFISIHHNASANPDDFWTNFTSTFYHAKQGSYSYEPFDHELARYVQRDLAFIMMNSGGLGSFDGTYSDYLIYPGDGFAVLRESSMPAILVECAFHTNRMEEIRLASKEFNRIQAWGIFKGLGKFFAVERPEIVLLKNESSLENGNLQLGFEIQSKVEIDPFSIESYFDSTFVNHEYGTENNKVIMELKNINSGEHIIKLRVADILGNYAIPYERKILTN